MKLGRRRILSAFLALFAFLTLYRGWQLSDPARGKAPARPVAGSVAYKPDASFIWRKIKPDFPVASMRPVPTAARDRMPPVQATAFPDEKDKTETRRRRDIVKASFLKSWSAYKTRAWLSDEVTPISGEPKTTFGGWGATLVDSLDTLWIMGVRDEFETAVDAVARNISFANTTSDSINVFETTIRFLGGLLSAHDLSGDRRLLAKAHDVGDMLYKAFDTPNRMPVARWDLHAALEAGMASLEGSQGPGTTQEAQRSTLLAEIGSLCMEFTRLSILTNDPRYYDATERISELLSAAQTKTKLPGMWPITVDAAEGNFDAGDFYSLGGMADSTYEYMPKMMALLGRKSGIYHDMYVGSVATAAKHLFFKPLTKDAADDVLFPGTVRVADDSEEFDPSAGHLTCFVGGMLAIGGKLSGREQHLDWAARMARGCVWAYKSFATGVMPETFKLAACPGDIDANCPWDEKQWRDAIEEQADADRLPPGFAKVTDSRYILRPEAIESVFVMYRVTGDKVWRDVAWQMWLAIDALTSTDLANSAVWNMNPEKGEDTPFSDSMESFWLGETLKYFYLIFSEPQLVSLDDWVFNTEAHPFKRLKKSRVK